MKIVGRTNGIHISGFTLIGENDFLPVAYVAGDDQATKIVHAVNCHESSKESLERIASSNDLNEAKEHARKALSKM